MIIPINIALAGPSSKPLPPQFAQYGTDEVVLVELQGALEVEGESSGQVVGKLSVDNETVRAVYIRVFAASSTRLHDRKSLRCSLGTICSKASS